MKDKESYNMSDSDDDPTNIFGNTNEGTTFCAKGPNTTTNVTSLSFRTNFSSSTRMPWNMEQQRKAEFNFGRKNHSYRRETSPMSQYSGYNTQPRNFNPYYRNGSSHRSMINGRGGSPMSMRSIDSTASLSATDIVMALKTANFNKYDFRLIKDAYNKYIRHRIRTRIQKRRNLKFSKGVRRKSGYDSGEQGSNSSLSSDDCRSTRTINFKENLPRFRSPERNLRDFHQAMVENNMLTGCSKVFTQNTLQKPSNIESTNKHQQEKQFHEQERKQKDVDNLQNERFINGFVLPSQRFNKTVTALTIQENSEQAHKLNTSSLKDRFTKTSFLLPSQRFNNNKTANNTEKTSIFEDSPVPKTSNIRTKNKNIESSSNTDEIIKSSIANKKLNKTPNKRNLDSLDNSHSDNKRRKLSSPIKPIFKEQLVTKDSRQENDFIFAKPKFPVRKSANTLTKKISLNLSQTDASSRQSQKAVENHKKITLQEETTQNSIKNADTSSNNGVSERPSFIKRRLFTQKLDIVENKNSGSDSSTVNSPQTKGFKVLHGEKNKTRKLVASQSCLNRDVTGEDKSFLDLIHKIVPADQINMTISNKSDVRNSKSKEDDRWDVTSVISTCNMDNISETFTDEEIFDVDTTVINAKQKEAVESMPNCKVMVENMFQNKKETSLLQTKQNGAVKAVKSFWDESDIETDLDNDITSVRHRNSGAKQFFSIFKSASPQHNTSTGISKQNKNQGQKEPVKVLKVQKVPVKKNNKTTAKNDKANSMKNVKEVKQLQSTKLDTKTVTRREPRKSKENKCTDDSVLDNSLNGKKTIQNKKKLEAKQKKSVENPKKISAKHSKSTENNNKDTVNKNIKTNKTKISHKADNKNESLTKSLRSRDIDLSSSFELNKSKNSIGKRTPAKARKK